MGHLICIGVLNYSHLMEVRTMKLKNSFYFTVACLVLAYDYAWNNYLLPSIVMTLVALVLAYLIARPSRNECVQLLAQSISIYCIEVIVLLLINQGTSTWMNPILALSTIAFYGCWIIVYEKSKQCRRVMFEKFLSISLIGFAICLVIPMILFSHIYIVKYNITLFLIFMLMPILFTVGITYVKSKLTMTYSYHNKMNI